VGPGVTRRHGPGPAQGHGGQAVPAHRDRSAAGHLGAVPDNGRRYRIRTDIAQAYPHGSVAYGPDLGEQPVRRLHPQSTAPGDDGDPARVLPRLQRLEQVPAVHPDPVAGHERTGCRPPPLRPDDPTRRGQRLLAHLDQPAIRELLLRYAHANARPKIGPYKRRRKSESPNSRTGAMKPTCSNR
jgi:hypothetical protein